jgi:hypothetical protein
MATISVKDVAPLEFSLLHVWSSVRLPRRMLWCGCQSRPFERKHSRNGTGNIAAARSLSLTFNNDSSSSLCESPRSAVNRTIAANAVVFRAAEHFEGAAVL